MHHPVEDSAPRASVNPHVNPHVTPLARALTETAQCLRFYTRLPVPALPWEDDPHALPDFSRMTRMLPVAGLIVGCVGAIAFALPFLLGLGSFISAAIAIAALTFATGAFHEDGLADTFDAFGGGTTRERKLEIMKDSRIGTFGGAALMLGLILRIALIAALADALGLLATMAALVTVAGLSRTFALLPLTLLEPARLDGASAAVGRPSWATFAIACIIAVLASLAIAWPAGHAPASISLALVLAFAACVLMTRWSKASIGGQTGDVAGAAQQLAEIGALIGLLILATP
jgi:adenosylcobinamide-GDP ribazoletransferase